MDGKSYAAAIRIDINVSFHDALRSKPENEFVEFICKMVLEIDDVPNGYGPDNLAIVGYTRSESAEWAF